MELHSELGNGNAGSSARIGTVVNVTDVNKAADGNSICRLII